MKTIEDIINSILSYNPKADVEPVRKAYAFAEKAHAGQVRHSGEQYLSHPMEVADILTQLKLDVPSIVAGILHDTVEDSSVSLDEIGRQFGETVALLVDGVTNIGKIVFKTKEERQAENFRKMVLSMSKDIRVILIKLADRLHNMRTLQHHTTSKQQWIAQETIDIYAPLANRLGIGWIKAELEDLCLRYLKPEIYFELADKVAKRRDERDKYINEVIEIVRKSLAEHGFKADVQGRSKHFHSVYQKMQREAITFDEIYDLTAIRIITDTKFNCYGILGMIHSLWTPVPGKFKDYIGVPKSNMYQSLHTTVICQNGERVEFQIRTEDMHRVAEEGIAAHWKYKEKGYIDEKDESIFSWLRQLVEWQKDVKDSKEFMDTLRVDMFSDVVYIFTPKGDIRELPKGSTPIDFAYSIHSDVGNHCVGAKINGKIVPLKYQLRSGDTVDVMTDPKHIPNKDWLKIVKTPRAKNRIKQWVKIEERRRSFDIGKNIFERELKRNSLIPNDLQKHPKLSEVLKHHHVSSIDDLIVAIGYGKVSVHQVVNVFVSEKIVHEKEVVKKQPKSAKIGVRIKDIDDILVHFAKCCNPVTGDKIVGFITRGRGLTIHTTDCPNIDEFNYNKDRIIEVEWDRTEKKAHHVEISVLTLDKPGLLANVSSAITTSDANITHAEAITREDKKAVLNFIVDINDLEHLKTVLEKVQRVDGVLQAKRVRKG